MRRWLEGGMSRWSGAGRDVGKFWGGLPEIRGFLCVCADLQAMTCSFRIIEAGT